MEVERIPVNRKDYTPTPYNIKNVHLTLDLSFTRVIVQAETNFQSKSTAVEDLVLDGSDFLTLVFVKINGKELGADAYALVGDKLTIRKESLPGPTFTLVTKSEFNPEANSALEGIFKTGVLLCSQCEAHGFRRITYFYDRPDVMTSFVVRLEADKTVFPVLLSNGNCVEEGPLENGRHFAVYSDPHLKPCYLFAVVAGQLHVLKEHYQHPDKPQGKKAEVRIFSEDEDLKKLHWAMKSVKLAMQWDEDRFGREYDLDIFNIVSVRHFNMGAMENKSLNVFLSSLILAHQDFATDTDFAYILGVVGHEYFHNWTGNRVTCRDWFQLTLKEGLTVFRDHEFSQDVLEGSVKRIGDVNILKRIQFPEDAGPLAHPIRPESYLNVDNFYTATVYEKGSEVVRMYQTMLGKDGFRKGMDLYFARHDGQAVTCDDFRAAMADANSVDLTQFELWYSQLGTPTLKVTDVGHDAEKKEFSFSVEQILQKDQKPLLIPLAFGLIDRASKQEVHPTEVYHFTKSHDRVVVPNIANPAVLSILRGFSAPVHLDFDQSDEDLLFLAANDTDHFCRFQALQIVTQRIILAKAEALAAKKDLQTPIAAAAVEAFRSIATDGSVDAQFRAFMLRLPDVDTLTPFMKPADPLALYAARDAVRRALGSALQTEFRALYQSASEVLRGAKYELTREQMGRRALVNISLSYLGKEELLPLAQKQFLSATNMTERMGAALAVNDYEGEVRTAIMDKFYQDGKHDDLIVDKWFRLQGIADLPDTLERVEKLLTHPLFDIKTPSRVRSLIGAFTYNIRQFHREDGKGYLLLADFIIHLDFINPMVAARLASALSSWQKYTPEIQVRMKVAINKILGNMPLSNNTYEILNKSIKG